jgi:hypothetical protein
MMLRLIMTMVLCFGVTIPFTACGKNTKENTGGDDANWTAQIPNIEGSLTKPNTAMPVVDTESLYGDYDETNADCFLELTGRGAVAYIQEDSALESKDVTIARNNIYGTDTTFGTVIEIKKSGTYVLQGDLSQGFVSIAKKDIDVTLVLNGVNIYCANYAPIVCLKKSNIQIHLAPNSTNYLTDGGVEIDADGKYTINYDGEEQPNATILTRKDLVINGTGTLIVNGNGNNGIGSRANLTIESGNITINAKNNAIKGNDTVSITGGADSSGYGNGFGMPSGSLKALITVAGGNIYITHSGSKSADGLDANGSIVITGGTLNITKPNGYTDYEPLDCDVSLTMTGGSVYIDGVLYTKDTITNIGGMQHGGSMNGKNPPRR